MAKKEKKPSALCEAMMFLNNRPRMQVQEPKAFENVLNAYAAAKASGDNNAINSTKDLFDLINTTTVIPAAYVGKWREMIKDYYPTRPEKLEYFDNHQFQWAFNRYDPPHLKAYMDAGIKPNLDHSAIQFNVYEGTSPNVVLENIALTPIPERAAQRVITSLMSADTNEYKTYGQKGVPGERLKAIYEAIAKKYNPVNPNHGFLHELELNMSPGLGLGKISPEKRPLYEAIIADPRVKKALISCNDPMAKQPMRNLAGAMDAEVARLQGFIENDGNVRYTGSKGTAHEVQLDASLLNEMRESVDAFKGFGDVIRAAAREHCASASQNAGKANKPESRNRVK